MIKNNLNYLRMVGRSTTHVNYESELISDDKALIATLLAITNKVGEIKSTGAEQQMQIKGLAEKRLQYRRILVDKIDIFASSIKSYASTIGDKELLGKVDYTYSDIWRLRDLYIENRVDNLINIATPILHGLADFSITEESIDDLKAEKDHFSKVKLMPKQAIKDKKEATQLLKQLMKELREIIDVRLDSDMKKYKLRHPKFYNGYLIQREINDTPTHHISLKGNVTDGETGEPLFDVTVTIEKLEQEAETTEMGNYQFKTLEKGTHEVTFEKEGYQTQTLKAEIIEGRTTTLDIRLIKEEKAQ
jgi:hypothetical protein